MGSAYRSEPPRAAEQQLVGKLRARKPPKGAPTHVRWRPLRPDPAQCRAMRTRFFTGARVYNAVLGEFIARSGAVKSDPAWRAAGQLPRRTKEERAARRAAFRAVAQAHGFTAGEAQSFASSLCQSWVRERKVLSTRIVRTVINGRETYRIQLVCDGYPTRRHPVGDGRVSFDLGPSEVAVAVERSD